MAAINLGDVEHSQARSPYRVPARRWDGTAHRFRSNVDPAMMFAALVLLVSSLVRLVPPLSGREAFGAEPTLALGAAGGCAWIGLREMLFRFLDYRAARRARAARRTRALDRARGREARSL